MIYIARKSTILALFSMDTKSETPCGETSLTLGYLTC